MDKKDFKKALPAAILVLLLIPVITSSILDIRQERKEKQAQQKLLAEQEAQRLAEKKMYLMGKFDQTKRNDFVLIPLQYANTDNPMYLRQEAYQAFLQMEATAKLDGINLKIASATRNFYYQRDIWEKKWTGATLVDGENLSASLPEGSLRFRKILEYSAAPGTSRHHWGTDIDLNYAIPSYFEEGRGKEIYDWLTANAPRFGFCQVYNAKNSARVTGYQEEKWHWSYLPLAKQFTEEYKNLIAESDLTGFLGEEYAPGQNLISDYVLSINPECL